MVGVEVGSEVGKYGRPHALRVKTLRRSLCIRELVLNARDVLDKAVGVGLGPYIDAVGEMCARLHCVL